MNRLLQAARFAAEKHTSQRRKNPGQTPYINHPVEVAAHLSEAGGIEDEEVLMAALLHDTIEDTDTSEEEINDLFGSRVARMVVECTDDKSLKKEARKEKQIEKAPHLSAEAKMIKIADKTCNLRSILTDPPEGWSPARQREYFEWADKVVSGLLGQNESLDQLVVEVLEKGKNALS